MKGPSHSGEAVAIVPLTSASSHSELSVALYLTAIEDAFEGISDKVNVALFVHKLTSLL